MNSHIKAVRQAKGEAGVQELERLYGKPLTFRNSDDVPVSDEVHIIEHALDLLCGQSPIDQHERAFEAGRLHFRNFVATPLARIILSVFRREFKLMMLQAHNIAGHVFQGVRFSSVERGPTEIKVVMENNDYPMDHFRGLFHEWLHYAGHSGSVDAQETSPNVYEYTIRWS